MAAATSADAFPGGSARHRPRSRSAAVDIDVLVLAELNLDVIVQSARPPEFGQVEQRVAGAAITLGSSGAITAAALAALGLRVALCGTVGDDPSGTLVLDALTGLGVDVSAVRRLPGRATGVTVVLTAPDGDRALMTYPGTMSDSTTAAVPRELLERSRHLHLSSIYLQTGLRPGLAQWLAGRPPGLTVSVDPGWDPDQSWVAVRDVLPNVDFLLPNENECLAIDGEPGTTVPDAARRLAALGPSVVVKQGAAGALVVSDAATEAWSIAAPVRRPVDTTGAGDNFDAGFLAAVLRGADPVAALAAGCACGAISVEGIGGTGRLATADEAARLAAALLAGGSSSSRSIGPVGREPWATTVDAVAGHPSPAELERS